MPKPRLLLHIGTHKTGTTAIQDFFFRHRATNMAQFNLYYPRTDYRDAQSRNHSFLLLPSQPIKASTTNVSHAQQSHHKLLIEDILASGAATAFVSAEGLSGPNPRFAESCREFALYFDTTVIVFLRRQDLFAESLHAQFVRDRGESRDIGEFVRAKRISSWLDYSSTLGFWERIFGAQAICVIPYDNATLKNGLMAVLSEKLSLPFGEINLPRRHDSPGREVVELMRLINKFGGLRKGIRRYPRKTARTLVKLMSELEFNSGIRNVFCERSRAELLEKYAAGNSELAQRYLSKRDGQLFANYNMNEGCAGDWKLPEKIAVQYLTKVVTKLTEGA